MGSAGGTEGDVGDVIDRFKLYFILGKIYKIHLNKTLIGTTRLEKADAPMGVVFGEILFSNIPSGYDFFKEFCVKNNVEFTDYPEDKLISTSHIPGLQIFDIKEKEIKGLSNSISGMDNDVFEITIEGIDYPFYEEEFPHHVKS